MSRRSAFTLVEVCLAVGIALLMVFVAVPSIRGVLAQNRLRRSAEDFDKLAVAARLHSIEERRTYAIFWRKDALTIEPLERTEEPPEGTLPSLPRTKDQDFRIERPAAMQKDPQPVWTFWRSGACEPVLISYTGPEGTWKAEYTALACRRIMLEEELR